MRLDATALIPGLSVDFGIICHADCLPKSLPLGPFDSEEPLSPAIHTFQANGKTGILIEHTERIIGADLQANETRLLAVFGVKRLLIIGRGIALEEGINRDMIVVIKDHINMTGSNPLIGENVDALGPRFPDMSTPYDTDTITALQQGEVTDITIKTGICGGIDHTPSYSKAGLEMIRTLGADVASADIVHPCILANHAGIKVTALVITGDPSTNTALDQGLHQAIQTTFEGA